MNFEGGEVRIDLRPVSSLLPHEETIPEQLKKLTKQIQREGVQKDPVIVDRESGTVLDGMHRLAAFGRLGLENAVCCLVDYSSKGIELRRWARVYRTNGSRLVRGALDELGLTREVTMARAFDALDNRETGVAVIGQDVCRVSKDAAGLDRAFQIVKNLDGVASALGWQRGFAREDEVDVSLQEKGNLVLLVERINKQDVLDAARSRRLFPCKTSMHTIDPRPVALGFPLRDLSTGTSKSVREFLAGRPTELLPAGSMYEGRRYKERLLVLDRR